VFGGIVLEVFTRCLMIFWNDLVLPVFIGVKLLLEMNYFILMIFIHDNQYVLFACHDGDGFTISFLFFLLYYVSVDTAI
jgi:hypothetical protein